MIIKSLLDNDLYKISMLQFIVDQKLDKLIIGWQFFSRGNNKFPVGFGKALKSEINSWKNLSFQDNELDFLYERTKKWINYDFIYGYLKSYKLDTSLIRIQYNTVTEPNIDETYETLSLQYQGEWAKVIMFEVLLLAVMNEIYSSLSYDIEKILSFSEILNRNTDKFKQMKEKGITFAEMGTRRRYNMENQDVAIKNAIDYGVIISTSNLYFAKKYNLPVVGTFAHELPSVYAALYGVESANSKLLHDWSETFNGENGTFLTDTFTTEHFLTHSFNRYYAKLYDGVREDSAPDPFKYVDTIIKKYKELGVESKNKRITHSNGIDSVELAEKLLNYRKDEIQKKLGIGTYITNDVSREGSGKQLNNWVIKVTHIITKGQKRYTVKLSDKSNKITTISPKTATCYKFLLGVEE